MKLLETILPGKYEVESGFLTCNPLYVYLGKFYRDKLTAFFGHVLIWLIKKNIACLKLNRHLNSIQTTTEQNTLSISRLELLSSARLVRQENEPSRIYFGTCKLNYLDKLKPWLTEAKYILEKPRLLRMGTSWLKCCHFNITNLSEIL